MALFKMDPLITLLKKNGYWQSDKGYFHYIASGSNAVSQIVKLLPQDDISKEQFDGILDVIRNDPKQRFKIDFTGATKIATGAPIVRVSRVK